MIKIQSNIEYSIGTIMYDEDTGEVYEVTRCDRIRLNSMEANFGITLRELKK